MLFRTFLLAGAMFAGAAQAQTQETRGDVYTLGELQVTARNRAGEQVGGAVVTHEQLRRFNKVSVDQALDLVSGTAAGASGGSRNERLVFVRGFDRFQTTLSIDGVRVFLPADNRIDFARFLTADLSEMQVSKGYVSVLDGPGGLGGAINLVTRKPVQPFEAEMQAGVGLDRDGTGASYGVSGRLGFRTDHFYGQVSGARNERDHWALPKDFTPTTLENGGFRDHSDTDDWRINLKVGFTPNDTDEYSLTYTRQEGAKNAPYHVNDTASTRFWDWPYWDIDSIAFLSNTQVSDRMYVRTRLYRNTFKNGLLSFDNFRQNSQTLPRAFASPYDDASFGGNVEMGFDMTRANTLKAVAYYRHDSHTEAQRTFSPALVEPPQVTKESTTSIAIEDTQRFGDNLDLVVGASWDRRNLSRAEDFNANAFVYYPLTDDDAWNWQGALIYRPTPDTQVHASVSSRVRFPTLGERFSSRFGTSVPNPTVKAERATSYEIGGKTRLATSLNLEGAVFYSELNNALILIPVQLGPPFGLTNQTRNAADGHYYGAEASFTLDLAPSLTLGGNYTYLHRKLTDPTNINFRPTGVPTHKAFVYADWRIGDRFTVTPSVEVASDRWTVTSSSLINPPRFYRTGSYALANLVVGIDITPKVNLLIGARNLLDASYQLVDGFPEEGRNFRADLRVRF